MRMKWISIFFIGLAMFLITPSVFASVADGGMRLDIASDNMQEGACISDYYEVFNAFRKTSWHWAGEDDLNEDALGIFTEDQESLMPNGIVRNLSTMTGSGGSPSRNTTSYWYCSGTPIDLADLLAIFSNLDITYEIEDSGVIVGSITIAGCTYSFVIKPMCEDDSSQVPVPGALLLLGSSVGALGLLKRRRG